MITKNTYPYIYLTRGRHWYASWTRDTTQRTNGASARRHLVSQALVEVLWIGPRALASLKIDNIGGDEAVSLHIQQTR